MAMRVSDRCKREGCGGTGEGLTDARGRDGGWRGTDRCKREGWRGTGEGLTDARGRDGEGLEMD